MKEISSSKIHTLSLGYHTRSAIKEQPEDGLDGPKHVVVRYIAYIVHKIVLCFDWHLYQYTYS